MKDNRKNMSDAQLVRLALENPDDYLCLIEKYEAKLMRYVHRLINVTREEAEDLLQDIFIKVYRNLNGFNRKLKFSSWIYRIAHNEILNFARKKNMLSNLIRADMPDSDGISIIDEIPGPQDSVSDFESKQYREKMETALMELSLKYREVLVLRFFEDKTYDEISDILRKPQGTVATLINRAKKKFKKIAEKHKLEEILWP